jgi:hypothetical protein
MAWLHYLATISLVLGIACAIAIAIDGCRHPQPMWIMNVVWPLTALFGTVPWPLGYFRFGRLDSNSSPNVKQGERHQTGAAKPVWVATAEATSHCGSGCALGDICAEWLMLAYPALAIWFGWNWLFSEKIFATWILDYVFAYAFGIIFQYYTIAPMRNLGLIRGIWDAVKADTLSLTAWQIGMYGFMAFAHFWLFRHMLGVDLTVLSVEFWFMMQIAMVFGLMTSYPVNRWLLNTGLKERM